MPDLEYLPEPEVFSALDQKALLVTVNRRLSRTLHYRFNEFQQSKDLSVWETPQIFPWSGWISSCLEKASCLQPEIIHPLCISMDQELVLWEEIIRTSGHARGILHLEETARQARQARILYRQWMLMHHDDPVLWSTPEIEAFTEWNRSLDERISTNNWLEEAGQPEYVADLLEKGIISCPDLFILAGFAQLSPVQEHILNVLSMHGCAVHALKLKEKNGLAKAVSMFDRGREIKSAALWIRKHLTNRTAESIGVVVPDLSMIRGEIEHTFDAVLHPDTLTSPLPVQNRIFDLTLGKPLDLYPLIITAMNILELADDPVDTRTLSAVLNSSFVHGAKPEAGARGRFDAVLRERREHAAAWTRLFYTAGKNKSDSPGYCPLLLTSMQSFRDKFSGLPSTQAPSAWSRTFDLLLEDFGWPGERSLLSHEYQTIKAWHECLRRLGTLDSLQPELTLDQARARLKNILQSTVFQPESSEVPVRVMGMLEAEGEKFDRLWIMGLTDQIWPPYPDPSPFLPAALQRGLNMPRSGPEQELAHARKILDTLLQSAEEVILSHPQREEDRELLPSPLILDIPIINEDDLNLPPYPDPWLNRPLQENLTSFHDEQGPILPEAGWVIGGSGLLKSQALCPFQAFARHRLGARSLEEPVPGLGTLERGTIIHFALEHFWRSCQDQAFLLALSTDELSSRIQDAAGQAVKSMQAQKNLSMTPEFSALEMERVQNLLHEWLELEAGRAPFQVYALEKPIKAEINGLSLNVVADRLDRLENGELVIIDYKTGQPSVSEWFKDRPGEPQLPIYSLFCPESVAGVYFGLVRKGQCSFAGLGHHSDVMPGVKGFDENRLSRDYDSWENLLEAWNRSLENLAGEYIQGFARVDPVSPQTCRTCDLGPLCRWFELNAFNNF